MKVYHYTWLDKWEKIKEGSWESGHKPGLGAILRVGLKDMRAWETTAAFGFTDPIPQEWVENNQAFQNVWERLQADMGELLLEVEVDPEKDPVFVIDRGHFEGFKCLNNQKAEGISPQYLHSDRAEAEGAYIATKIPLKDYLKRKDELKYALPEIIISENVPFDKISISENQPILEEKLIKYRGAGYETDLIKRIKRIPELSGWYERYRIRREQDEPGKEIKMR